MDGESPRLIWERAKATAKSASRSVGGGGGAKRPQRGEGATGPLPPLVWQANGLPNAAAPPEHLALYMAQEKSLT